MVVMMEEKWPVSVGKARSRKRMRGHEYCRGLLHCSANLPEVYHFEASLGSRRFG